jgi:hypothetical protein
LLLNVSRLVLSECLYVMTTICSCTSIAQGLSEAQALAGGHANLDIFTASFRPMRNTVSGSPLRTFMKVRGIHVCVD